MRKMWQFKILTKNLKNSELKSENSFKFHDNFIFFADKKGNFQTKIINLKLNVIIHISQLNFRQSKVL